eukprot:scaffold107660_cov42-Prasinocladus_malaysianus.AAC.1
MYGANKSGSGNGSLICATGDEEEFGTSAFMVGRAGIGKNTDECIANDNILLIKSAIDSLEYTRSASQQFIDVVLNYAMYDCYY